MDRSMSASAAMRGKAILTRSLAAVALCALFAVACPPAFSADPVMRLKVLNNSGFPDSKVFFIVVCQTPLGYLDFRTHAMVETPSFSLDTASMTASLEQIRQYSGDGSATIICPAMGSSRLYFCLGENFDKMGGFSASGPEFNQSNPVPYAKFELNLSGVGFINSTDVDFFSIAYTLSATRAGGGTVTVGITNSSATIFRQFEAIPSPADIAQRSGNQDIFKACIVRNPAGGIVRVVAPKAMSLAQASYSASMPQMFSHYLDEYVNRHCWKPGRQFSFSSKIASDPVTYYGKVSADGLTLSIFTDAAMTVPYAVPSLPRPSGEWGKPDFAATPQYWHNVGVASIAPQNIDWGYLLCGQDGYSSGPGAHWISDPVAMAVLVSIVRGVMHMDNGTVDWKNAANYYRGAGGSSAEDFPIFYYADILHRYGIDGHVYALSYDDVYGLDSGIALGDPSVTLSIYPFTNVPAGASSVCASDFDADGLADPASVSGNSWHAWLSSANYAKAGPAIFAAFAGGTAVAADFDADRKADPASVSGNSWYVWLSSANYAGVGPVTFVP